MMTTHKAGKLFNLACSIKEFITAGHQQDKDYAMLPRYGEGTMICKPQDVPNSKDSST
jgi:hypothetical protein